MSKKAYIGLVSLLAIIWVTLILYFMGIIPEYPRKVSQIFTTSDGGMYYPIECPEETAKMKRLIKKLMKQPKEIKLPKHETGVA